MKIEGTQIILETGDKFTGEGYTFVVREKSVNPQPTPTPSGDGRIDVLDLIGRFNNVLLERGYRAVDMNMGVYEYISWAYDLTRRMYDTSMWMFKPETYPLVYDYRGNDTSDDGTAYNALQAWLMASELAELVPDDGYNTNTQTELFKLAYEIGGGRSYPLYNNKAFKQDPYAMREAASVMYAICRGDSNISRLIDVYRQELGGKKIQASNWDGLGYQNTMLSDSLGRRGYRMDYLGYAVNTELFLPDAPAPRVEGTTVCELPWPWEEGQEEYQFNMQSGNYDVDEIANLFFVDNWNMMSQTPLSVWNSYPKEKQNRLVNIGAIPPCTFIYMFGKKKVKFDGIIHKAYGTNPAYDYYCFSQTSEDTGLALEGPFSEFDGIYRYNTMGDRERCLETVATIFDNFRFPTEDPNYGRCRPGCKVSRTVESLNPVKGAAENEIYNVDLCVMVADNVEGTEKGKIQDGFAADSPRSYVSGHSAQIWGLALMLTQMNNDGNCEHWIKKAFEYSINRSVGRFHWNSDCVYGRLFGSLALPIINTMSGLENGLKTIRDYVLNPTPVPVGNWDATIIVKNETGKSFQSTGEVRLYIPSEDGGHIGINVYLPNASASAGAQYSFGVGENAPWTTQCAVNGGYPMLDEYDGVKIIDGRIYDQRHYSNGDWTPPVNVLIDTDDARCSAVLKKSGATYVLKVVNA